MPGQRQPGSVKHAIFEVFLRLAGIAYYKEDGTRVPAGSKLYLNHIICYLKGDVIIFGPFFKAYMY